MQQCVCQTFVMGVIRMVVDNRLTNNSANNQASAPNILILFISFLQYGEHFE